MQYLLSLSLVKYMKQKAVLLFMLESLSHLRSRISNQYK